MLYHPRWSEVIPDMDSTCKDCGCVCSTCDTTNRDNIENMFSLDLHHEIEELRSKLVKSQSQVSLMERDFSESQEYSEGEIGKLQDELAKLRDRYDRLFESHKKLQKLNHTLEDKLLTVVGRYEAEKLALQTENTTLSENVREAKILICDLEEECEKYRTDCNTAVQMLQCKPSTFVAHRLNTLPLDLQQRVKSHLTRTQVSDLEEPPSPVPASESKMIRVPMPTFPPTAMVYSINSKDAPTPNNTDNSRPDKLESVPTDIIAKVLSHPDTKARQPRRFYVCDRCRTDIMVQDTATQTTASYMDTSNTFQRSGANRPPQSAILIQPSVHAKQSFVEVDLDV